MRKYTIDRRLVRLLIFEYRQILKRDWHDRIARGSMPALSGHWSRTSIRELALRIHCGYSGASVPNLNRPGRWIHVRDDAGGIQDAIDDGYAIAPAMNYCESAA